MSNQEKALQRLQRLQTAVAVAWDGNLPARSGELDPDSYTVELLRAERSRLSLKHEWLRASTPSQTLSTGRQDRSLTPCSSCPLMTLTSTPYAALKS